jgi:hypothetical protein
MSSYTPIENCIDINVEINKDIKEAFSEFENIYLLPEKCTIDIVNYAQ